MASVTSSTFSSISRDATSLGLARSPSGGNRSPIDRVRRCCMVPIRLLVLFLAGFAGCARPGAPLQVASPLAVEVGADWSGRSVRLHPGQGLTLTLGPSFGGDRVSLSYPHTILVLEIQDPSRGRYVFEALGPGSGDLLLEVPSCPPGPAAGPPCLPSPSVEAPTGSAPAAGLRPLFRSFRLHVQVG